MIVVVFYGAVGTAHLTHYFMVTADCYIILLAVLKLMLLKILNRIPRDETMPWSKIRHYWLSL